MAHVGHCQPRSRQLEKWHEARKNPMKQEIPLRILIADDSAEWRVRIRSILKTRPELQVIGEAGDGLDAVHTTTALRPDIVLLDIGMPVLNGVEAAKQIRPRSPSSRIVFLTQENDEEIRTAALAAGAEGYVLKANAGSELLPAIEAACSPEVASPA
jgi:DNA-binding NarL/FixJ family response regulator